jgi:tetratricopeptide (TPR) repeat protein
MLKKFCPCFILFCALFYPGFAAVHFQSDNFIAILKIGDQVLREKKLTGYIESLAEGRVNNLKPAIAEMETLLVKYNPPNNAAFKYFIDGVSEAREANLNQSEKALGQAISLAGKNNDHYLSYRFFTYLSFIRSGEGNTIGAVSGFRMAKKEAIALNDPYLQVVIDVNISDIYYRNNFYSQSLFYLDQAQSIFTGQ